MVRVKMCGMMSRQDLNFAETAGADAVGRQGATIHQEAVDADGLVTGVADEDGGGAGVGGGLDAVVGSTDVERLAGPHAAAAQQTKGTERS